MLTPEECAEIKARVVPDLDRIRSIQRRRACSGARGQTHPDPAFAALCVLDDSAEAIAALLATVEALRSELAEAVRVLSELEWVRRDWGGSSGFECPCCGAHDYLDKEEHEDGCDLAVFLARHGGV